MKFKLRGQVFEREDDLWDELCYQWKNISQDFIEKLYKSFLSRMNAAIASHGGVTKY